MFKVGLFVWLLAFSAESLHLGSVSRVHPISAENKLHGPKQSEVNIVDKQNSQEESRSPDSTPTSNFRSLASTAFTCRCTDTFTTTLQKRLENAAVISHRLRQRVMVLTLGVGSVIFLSSFVMAGVSLIQRSQNFSYYISMLYPSSALALLGIMPNDVKTIRLVVVGMTLYFYITGFIALMIGFGSWFEQRHYYRPERDDEVFVCGSGLPDTGCAILAILNVGQGSMWIYLGWSLKKNIKKNEGTRIWDSTARKGFRFKDQAFKVPARKALDNIWLHKRIQEGFYGVTAMLFTVTMYVFRDEIAPRWTEEALWSGVFLGTVSSFSSAFFNARVRGRFIIFVTSMTGREEVREAASIAALLGSMSPADGLAMAQEHFRAIAFTNLTADDFKNSKEGEDDVNALFGRSSSVQLGQCDAFLSHSWSDNWNKKYQALVTWARKFRQKNNRDPIIWFDKACIDQNDIANDLLCLPIFLAGCEELLIVAGATYTTRLWYLFQRN